MRISRNDLIIPSQRQRKTMDKAKLEELKLAIIDHTLLHAPVVQKQSDGKFLLVAGERRTRAIDLIIEARRTFIHNQESFGWVDDAHSATLPVVLLDDALSQTGRAEVELAENVAREELPWQDRIQALAFIHSLKKQSNPTQTYTDTAKELVQDQKIAVGAEGAASVEQVRKVVRQAEIISQHLDNPAIAKARNATEAFNLILANEQRAFQAELIRRGQKKITSVEVRHGSLLDILPKLDSGQFDTILSDPPYGIDVNSTGLRSRTVHHHNYDDSPDTTRQLLQCIITEGFRVSKPRANLLLFCDIDFFGWLKEASARAGWDPFRTPITWVKSDSEGMAPWGREGFRRTTEWIFFARKGQKGLIHSPVDVLRHNRVGRADREYGPEKPESLLRELLAASTLPGDYVLDPCCGSGSTLAAARALNMKALGIEIDLDAYNLALVKSQREAQDAGRQHAPSVNQL